MILIFTLSAALCYAIGNLSQKIGLNSVRNKFPELKGLSFGVKVFLKPFWLLGIVLSTLGTLGYYFATAKWNLSLVQPLMCLNPVLTVVFGYSLLKEKLDRKTLLSLTSVFMGILLLSFHLQESSGQLGTSLWLFTGATIVLMFALAMMSRDQPEFMFTLLSGFGFGLSAVLWKAMASVFGGDIASQFNSVDGMLDFLMSPIPWVFAVAYIFGFITNQKALVRGRVLFVVPFSAAIGTVVPVLGGFIVFGEPESLLKVLSVIFILLGTMAFWQNK